MNDANNATPKRFMFVCEFCADNNPEMCGFFDADDLRVAPNGKWLCASCFDEDDSCLNHYYCWNDMPSPTFESLSTPNAPVEREAIALATMVFKAVQFADQAAGEGIFFDNLDPADILSDYVTAIGTDTWDGLPEVARDTILARLDEATIREKAFEDAAMIARQVAINAERRAADHTNLDAKQSALDKMAGAQEAEARIRAAASAIRGGKQP